MSLDVLRRDGYLNLPITRPSRNVLLVRATVNGQNVLLIVDTGGGTKGLALNGQLKRFFPKPDQAGVTVIRSVAGKALGVRHNVADSVVLGNAEFKNVPVDFGPLRMTGGAAGLMGAGFLRMCSAIIDLHNLRLYLRPPGVGRPVRIGPALTGIGFAEAPFKFVNNACLLDIELNSVPGAMFIDTGAPAGVIDPRFAAKAKSRSYRTRIWMPDVTGGGSRLELSRMTNFKIAGVTPLRAAYGYITPFAAYAPTHGRMVGLLGMDILGPNGTIIDFAQQKLYFFKTK